MREVIPESCSDTHVHAVQEHVSLWSHIMPSLLRKMLFLLKQMPDTWNEMYSLHWFLSQVLKNFIMAVSPIELKFRSLGVHTHCSLLLHVWTHLLWKSFLRRSWTATHNSNTSLTCFIKLEIRQGGGRGWTRGRKTTLFSNTSLSFRRVQMERKLGSQKWVILYYFVFSTSLHPSGGQSDTKIHHSNGKKDRKCG